MGSVPTFGIVNDNEELGGLSSELVGMVVAYLPLSTYTTASKFEPGKVDTVLRTRCYAVDVEGELEDLGVRLIFWTVPQRQIAEQTVNNDMAIGILEEIVQANDPERTVFVLQTPDPDQAHTLIAAFSAGSDDEAPF